jgi:hypothetical protein
MQELDREQLPKARRVIDCFSLSNSLHTLRLCGESGAYG